MCIPESCSTWNSRLPTVYILPPFTVVWGDSAFTVFRVETSWLYTGMYPSVLLGIVSYGVQAENKIGIKKKKARFFLISRVLLCLVTKKIK
jgi:nicotinic acid phosphoribosyltransferase